MNKIIYSITKIGKKGNTKITGIGCIFDNDIVVACTSTKDSKPYIRVFEDAVKHCHAVNDKEFKGLFSEIVEVPVEAKDGSTSTREVEVDYLIWYKKAE